MSCQAFGGIHFSIQGEYMNNVTRRGDLTVTLKMLGKSVMLNTATQMANLFFISMGLPAVG